MGIARNPALRARLASPAITAVAAGLALAASAWAVPAWGQEPVPGAPRADGRAGGAGDVVACDSLIALRQLMARAGEDRGAAAALVAQEPLCRALPRAEIGAVAHRAMVGGAPYECLAVQAAPACLWVLP
ncbi:hypothetical protein [Methylobacterium soli]|uniref:Uncharacterized protein n=1 Tax=Methylobacterium soli TaxID=553447 RepID=A0A6L3T8J3_9HYPH|nr:hypothetical protein [Methylobacterium soli]KAB1079896.1 hypothetical protein F6X53_09085 [Methylobacterium soli]GJE41894.1 hypothetical protein AEGHOMDF_1064 [Methylobacterium soli]